MTSNTELITSFYSAFARGDADAMSACYHREIAFQDPVFGKLEGDSVAEMWKMLIQRAKGQLKITFSDVKSHGDVVSVNWRAEYNFSKTGRKVINLVRAEFRFKDGLIVGHKDDFSFWNWSRQALGLTGLLLGWSAMFRKKVCHQARMSLENWQDKKIQHSDFQ